MFPSCKCGAFIYDILFVPSSGKSGRLLFAREWESGEIIVSAWQIEIELLSSSGADKDENCCFYGVMGKQNYCFCGNMEIKLLFI